MRTSLAGAVALAALGMTACASVLGDFSVGGASGGDGGGGDATVPTTDGGADAPAPPSDAPSQGNDARGDDGSAPPADASPPSDAGADAPATLRQLTCATSNPVQVTTGNSVHGDRIVITPLAGGNVRVVVADYTGDGGQGTQPIVTAYTFNPQQNNPNVAIDSVSVGGQILDLQVYGGAAPGIVAFYTTFQNGGTVLATVRIPNAASAWLTPTILSMPLLGNNNTQGTLAPIDPLTDDYYVVFSSVDPTNSFQTFVGGEARGAPASLSTLATYDGGRPYSLVTPGVALGGRQPYIMLQPQGNNGPPQVGTPAELLAPGGNPPSVTIAPPPMKNIFPYAFANAASDVTKVNLAFLVADLVNIVGTYEIGEVAVSALDTLDPSSLTATTPQAADGGAPGFADLLINNVELHWELANGTEQFFGVASTANVGGPTGGINLGWWDGTTGVVRAYAAGGNRLLPNVPTPNRANITVASLVGNIAQFYLVYEDAVSGNNHGGQPPACNLWVATVSCTP